MDYKTEQETEVELIHSVYPDETEIISREYPQMQLKVTLPSEPRFENPEPDFFVDLLLSLPAKYPEDAPAFELSGFPEDFPKKLIHELEQKLSDQAKSMPGYQVLITLITELQYQLPLMLKKVQDDRDAEEQRIRDEKEEAERKRFEGNRVTVESFNKWRVEFEREFLAAELEAKKAREALIGNKLTGKQLFLRDHSLNMSDLAMLEGEAETEAVEIDKSLFEGGELEDLDLDDDEDDERYEEEDDSEDD